MLKIINLVGARPQFIKSAGISRAMANDHDIEEIYVHSGQHYDPEMSDRFFEELHLPRPHFHLEGGKYSGRRQVNHLRERLGDLMKDIHPDAIIVYGDTNTTLAGALAARDREVSLAHVEAGLRSYNQLMPEEYNRVQTDRLSRWLFCPTPTAVRNLARESLLHTATRKVVLCGDVMFDNINFYGDRSDLGFVTGITGGKKYALLTIHRNYNTDNKSRLLPMLNNVVELVKEEGIVALIPLHPRLAKVVDSDSEVKKIMDSPFIKTVPPTSYGETLSLIKMSHFVLTDSGGVQKEAAMLGKRVLVLRTETEWVEWVESGHAKVVDVDLERMREAVKDRNKLSDPPEIFQKPAAPLIVKTMKVDITR